MPSALRTLLIARRTWPGTSAAFAGVHARRGQLLRIRRAVQVEPRAGGRVVLVILDAEQRHRRRAGQPVVHDHVVRRRAGRHVVHGDGLRGEIGSAAVTLNHAAAIGRERRVVHLDRLPHVHQRRAAGIVIVNVLPPTALIVPSTPLPPV